MAINNLTDLAAAISQLELRFRLRRRLAADWTSLNEVLLDAEAGYETDTGKLKIGDGTTAWNSLTYWAAGGVASIVAGTGVTVNNADPQNPIVSASGGGGASGPDAPPTSPDAMDDEFDGTSLDVKWTWLQQHTATATVATDRLALASELTTTNYINAIEQALPGGTCAFVVKMSANIAPGNSFCCLQLREASSGNCRGFGFYNSSGVQLIVASGSVSGGYTGVVANIAAPGFYYCALPAYLKVEITSTDFIFSVSSDGISYQVFGSYALTGSFTTAPDNIGIATRNTSSSIPCVAVVDYFRRIS